MTILGASEIPWAETCSWVLQQKTQKNKDISTLLKLISTMIWVGAHFFSPRDIHAKGLLVLFYLGLEGINDFDINPKGRFVSVKLTPSNNRVPCIYALSVYITRKHLGRGNFLKELQN